MRFIVVKTSIFITMIVLVLSIKASQTHNALTINHYLLHTASTDAYSSLFNAAQSSQESSNALLQLATKNQNIYWLKRLANQGSLEAILTLIELDESENEHYWISQAASKNHAPSQFELSLITQNYKESLRLKKLSAEQNYPPAIIALAKYYYENGQTELAKEYLIKASSFDSLSRFKLAKLEYKQGNEEKAIEHFKELSSSLDIANEYLFALERIKRTNILNLMPISEEQSKSSVSEQCSQTIQFVAISLETAVQAQYFKRRFEGDERLNELPICIESVVWVDESELECRVDKNRQACDLTTLSETQIKPNFTHLVFFLQQGKAYVNKGVMYLDEADPYSVFVHELAHFVGFADEYAVSSKLASHYCYSSFPSAPNILIANNQEQNIQTEVKYHYWQETFKEIDTTYSQEVITHNDVEMDNLSELPIAQANTCSKLGVVAYKPSTDITFMEFHDVEHIPDIYKIMWKQKLVEYHQRIMVANSFYEHAKSESAKVFWQNFI